MLTDYNRLDNPAWYALNERHAVFAGGTTLFKRYDPGIVLFAGFDTSNRDSFIQIDKVLVPGEAVFLFGNIPPLPPNYTTEATVECLQMVCPSPNIITITEQIVQLDESYTEEMYALVSKVFPGYYLPHTNRMGDYFGICKDGSLVSMAGERLCLQGLTEISAVVTHPAYTGRGFAQQLMSFIHQKHRSEAVVSFLHTGSGNERAIKLYELLGYKRRRLIMVTKAKRTF